MSEFEAPAGTDLYVIRTGDWRTQRPVRDGARCNGCGVCMMYCPVGCVRRRDGEFEFDMEFCKGCGVCAHECPRKAISMVEEGVSAE